MWVSKVALFEAYIITVVLAVNFRIEICISSLLTTLDKLKPEEIVRMLKNVNIDSKDLGIIKNTYWQQKAAIKFDYQFTTLKGIRTVCYHPICSMFTHSQMGTAK